MSKKQGQKSVKDVLWDNLLQMYRGKKKKRERSGNFFFYLLVHYGQDANHGGCSDSVQPLHWARYLDNNHSFTK